MMFGRVQIGLAQTSITGHQTDHVTLEALHNLPSPGISNFIRHSLNILRAVQASRPAPLPIPFYLLHNGFPATGFAL